MHFVSHDGIYVVVTPKSKNQYLAGAIFNVQRGILRSYWTYKCNRLNLWENNALIKQMSN